MPASIKRSSYFYYSQNNMFLCATSQQNRIKIWEKTIFFFLVHVKYVYSTIFNAQPVGSRINLSSEFHEKSGGNVCISLYNRIAREQRMKYRASTWRVKPGIPSTSSLFFRLLSLSLSLSPFLRLNSPFVAERTQTERHPPATVSTSLRRPAPIHHH